MCNGALMVSLNSLAPAKHKQPFIADNAYTILLRICDALKLPQPLYRLMLICINNQSIEGPRKTSNREE